MVLGEVKAETENQEDNLNNICHSEKNQSALIEMLARHSLRYQQVSAMSCEAKNTYLSGQSVLLKWQWKTTRFHKSNPEEPKLNDCK